MCHGYVNYFARIMINSFSWLEIWTIFQNVRRCFKRSFLFFNIQEKIGWRSGSRRLLLFSTDSGFHHAGDGKVCVFIYRNIRHFPCYKDYRSKVFFKRHSRRCPSFIRLIKLQYLVIENEVVVIFFMLFQKSILHTSMSCCHIFVFGRSWVASFKQMTENVILI